MRKHMSILHRRGSFQSRADFLYSFNLTCV